MRILVCLKQVPPIADLRFAGGTSSCARLGVSLETNPFDRRGLALAISLRETLGGTVTALSLGPPSARQGLLDALALGCDDAIHLLDDTFAGSDTLATSRILAAACRRLEGDLVVCGRSSTDAGAGVVPALLACLLDRPALPAVTRLESSEDGRTLVAVRETDDGFETVTCRTPALLSAAERLTKPLNISAEARAAVDPARITVWDRRDLRLPLPDVGTSGSPTHTTVRRQAAPARRGLSPDPGNDLPAGMRRLVRSWIDRGILTAGQAGPRIPEMANSPRPGTLWVILEAGDEGVRPASRDLLAQAACRAVDLHASVTAVVVGPAVAAIAPSLAAWGADRVLYAEAPDLNPLAVELHAALLRSALLRGSPDAVLLAATSYGRELAARLAAPFGLGVLTECSDFEPDGDHVVRLLRPSFFGGLAVATSTSRPVLATMALGVRPRCLPCESRRAVIEQLSWRGDLLPRRRTLAIETSAVSAPDLETAEIVLGVGMGIGGQDGIARIRGWAERLGAGLAASRRVVDAGWLPRQHQVGLTGRVIAPRLYLAVGMNGNAYHAAGVQRAGWITAVNTSPSPALAAMSDEVLRGDWQVLLPPLVEALEEAVRPPR